MKDCFVLDTLRITYDTLFKDFSINCISEDCDN